MNRIGLHVTNGTRLPLRGPHGAPWITKLHNGDVAYKRQVRAEVGPDCLIVVRWFEAHQTLAEPERAAEEWVARHYHDMRAMADGDPNVVFEGYNEIPDSCAPAFARFELRRLALMHAAGLRAGVGSWSVGTPDLHVWQIYRPVLAAMHPGDVVCLHEYWADGNDIGNHWLTARFAHPAVAPYLVGRRIAITEIGRDVIREADGRVRGARGWQRSCDADTFFDELRAYDALIGQHPRVIGATVFDDGSPDAEWHPYSPAPVWGRVVAEYTPATPAKGDDMTTVRVWRRGMRRVDTIELELYVRGVLPREMPASWHLEALKVGAVAARTYALHARRAPRHGAEGADLCDTACCQVYSDMLHARTDQAVRETDGETWDNPCQYVSRCGRPDCPLCRGAGGYNGRTWSGRLCQEGARHMAAGGATYREILALYYGGGETPQEDEMTEAELQAGRDRLAVLPATKKACNARGYGFEMEWFGEGAVYALAWNPSARKYHQLKLEVGSWRVLEDVAV